MARPALLLDRDGVVNREGEHLYRVEDIEFIDGLFDTCRYVRQKGYALVIITNQAGIARGKYDEEDFIRVTRWMEDTFREEGAPLDRVYHCPHHPEYTGDCSCRKPEPGMILRAASDLDLNLPASVLVGDKFIDVEAGRRAGVGHNLLVTTGHSFDREEARRRGIPVIENLREVKSFLINNNGRIS